MPLETPFTPFAIIRGAAPPIEGVEWLFYMTINIIYTAAGGFKYQTSKYC